MQYIVPLFYLAAIGYNGPETEYYHRPFGRDFILSGICYAQVV